jgi:hypothetical protein
LGSPFIVKPGGGSSRIAGQEQHIGVSCSAHQCSARSTAQLHTMQI